MCIMRMLQFLLMMVQIKKKWFTWVAKRFLEVEEDLNHYKKLSD